MNNYRKILGVCLIIIGLLLIIFIIYVIFFYQFNQPVATPVAVKPASQPVKTIPPAAAKATTTTEAAIPKQPVRQEDVKQEDLKRLATAFAERFGSFSNQSDFGNIRDLTIFMTAKMKSWAEDYISRNRAKNSFNNIYYGITTKAVTAEVEQYNNYDNNLGQAKVLVKTLRREATGVSNNVTSFNQEIEISLIKERGAWKVDTAYWTSR